jgi:hypothetical protein
MGTCWPGLPTRSQLSQLECQPNRDSDQLGQHQQHLSHPNQCRPGQEQQHQCQNSCHSDLYRLGHSLPAQCQQSQTPPSQQVRREIKSSEIMLEATRSCSLAGLYFCLLIISAVDLTSSSIFCWAFLPLLLFGCLLIFRFLISSQPKPAAMKGHKKRGRLKTGTTVAYDSAGASVNEVLGNDFQVTLDASASSYNLWIADGYVRLRVLCWQRG